MVVFHGKAMLGRAESEVWLMPIGIYSISGRYKSS